MDNGTSDLCDSSHTISNNRIMISLIGFLSLLTSADSPNDTKVSLVKITAIMTGHSGEHTRDTPATTKCHGLRTRRLPNKLVTRTAGSTAAAA